MVDNTHVLEIRSRVDAVLASRQQEIRQTVRNTVADVLAIDPSKVQMNASLIEDLGAESIDFLDLLFRLEGTYLVKIPRDGIRLAARDGLSENFEVNGVLTEEALERIRLLMPEVPAARVTAGLRAQQIGNLFTPETFVRLVAWRLAEEGSGV